MKALRLLAVAAVVLGCAAEQAPPPAVTAVEDVEPTIVLISFDGFRADYLQREGARTLRRLAREGVAAPEGMIPSFPTKTFPNHYTIATGLYPGHHGIVANTIYDPERDELFRIGDRDAVEDGSWWGGEPIWVTAQRQGQRAATFFWVGSEAPVDGVRPTHWRRFDNSIAGEERVDTALEWLDAAAAERPTMITLYFETTDQAGHEHGPDSPEIDLAIAEVDGYLARLVSGLDARGIADHVNLIVTADHGMSALSKERTFVLSDYVDLDDCTVVNISPNLGVWPPPGRVDEVYEALKDAHPRLRVFRKEESPERWHYRDHPRIPPIVGVVDDGWTALAGPDHLRAFLDDPLLGSHGFDPEDASMRAVFVARGPAFRQGLEIEPFENVHVYELMAHILGLDPAPNDGRLDVLRPTLRE